jgi:hypothetical protein
MRKNAGIIIERNEGVCALLHSQVHSKIRDFSFFLAEDIGI